MKIVGPGEGRKVTDEGGRILEVPPGWDFLPAGDAGVTRKVTSSSDFWRVQVRKGRRMISRGIWAPAESIADAKAAMEALRGSAGYKKKLQSQRKSRERKQEAYCREFNRAVLDYLGFEPAHDALAEAVARAVTDHAVPVGSGTVARTERIPLEERASRAVLAWMRHAVTDYDNLKIPRVKGARRQVRRELVARCSSLLKEYRTPGSRRPGDPECPLRAALSLD